MPLRTKLIDEAVRVKLGNRNLHVVRSVSDDGDCAAYFNHFEIFHLHDDDDGDDDNDIDPP